ncbi:type I-E CRISPR-associated protein Cas7/Cse4/CasC [Actinokineospora sp. HUAS TT18]|uniref:type I-E CRISPR-associated protein Cas7/Cse4/CasC n=1 Tax=Actinokineospora sp. HUAS TT18 TaxID=3447451 RepID=UPI003F524120
MPRTTIDLHVIQTVPPSNLNRDDTGSPKTAVYGGVRRARVSSQAWKRATRDAFKDLLHASELGVRTKRVIELISQEITRREPGLADRAEELALALFKAAGFEAKKPREKKGQDTPGPAEAGYLFFLSRRQIENLADLAVTVGDGKFDKGEVRARANRDHSVDVALFGRMVAEATDLNVEAACQVAHALSVHSVANEYDYFTAVDDHKNDDVEEDAGVGMIGTVEFNSSTLYRYATIDVDGLQANLGDVEATRRAVEAFIRAFVTSMPTGKQNTFANRTLPDAVLLVARESQSINLVGAYEDPVADGEKGGRITASLARLGEHAKDLHEAFDETPVAAWAFGGGERVDLLSDLAERTTINGAVAAVGELVAQRLEPSS